MVIKNDWQINKIIVVSSLLLSIILTLFYYHEQLDIIEVRKITPKEETSFYYADIFPDSNKIEILVENNPDYSFQFKKLINLKTENLFTINGYKIFENQISYSDVNDDGVNEIIVIYKRNKKVFLTVFDFINRTKIIDDLEIFKEPENARSKNDDRIDWGIDIINGGVIKTEENKKKLIFAITAWQAIYPRGIYSFDFRSQKIENKINFSSSPKQINFLDVDEDGFKEILFTTYSSYEKDVVYDSNKYQADRSWVLVLTPELKVIKEFSSGAQLTFTGIFTNNKKISFVSLFVPKLKSQSSCKLTKFNKKIIGSNIKRFPHIKGGITLKILKSQNVVLSFLDSLYLFDSDLQTLKKKKLEQIARIYNFSEFKTQNKLYYLFVSRVKINHQNIFGIMNENLDIVKSISFDKIVINSNQGAKFRTLKKTNLPEITFGSRNDITTFKVIKKSDFVLFSRLLLLTLLTTLFVFFIAKYVIKYVYSFYYYFSYSLGKSSNGIVLVDENKKIKFINQKAKEFICRNSKAKLNRKHIKEFYSNSEKLKSVLENWFYENRKNSIHLSINNGKSIYKLLIEFIPLIIFGKYQLGYYLKLNDLSDSIQVERAKVYSHSIQKITHEIKTPLSSILMNIKSLQIQINDIEKLEREEALEDLNLMENEVDRIRTLVNNLLKFANLQKPNFKKIDINSIISKALTKFENFAQKGVNFNIELVPDITVLADEHQLIEAFHVFIENGIDAMKANGVFVIFTQKAIYNNEEYIKISFNDSGGGISDEIKDVIFEPYVTTKREGTGMGLPIAKKIIEDHGSKIEFYSDKKGTEFSFLLKIV